MAAAHQPVSQPPARDIAVPRNVSTELNYYRDAGDGSAPEPVIVGRYEVPPSRRLVKTRVCCKQTN